MWRRSPSAAGVGLCPSELASQRLGPAKAGPAGKGPIPVLSDLPEDSDGPTSRFRCPGQASEPAAGSDHRRGLHPDRHSGFLVTGFENFAAETNKTLLGFEINPLHNLVHLAIGLAGLALWRRLDTARTYGWLLAAGYGLAFLYGLFAAGNSDINFLSLNGADNDLHLVSAVAGVAIALWPADRTVPRQGGVTDRST
jgi:hypothetical protein